MTKFNPFYLIFCSGIALSLFLPHLEYDLYTGGLFNSNELIEENIHENGLKNWFSFVPLITAIGTLLLANLYRSLGTAITGLVIMTLTLVYMPLEAFALTFDLFGPRKNETVQIGYYLKALFVLGYIVFMIVEVIKRAKERRQVKKAKFSTESDLLDDF